MIELKLKTSLFTIHGELTVYQLARKSVIFEVQPVHITLLQFMEQDDLNLI